MSSMAHHSISISVTGNIDTTWHISSHYCSDDDIGSRSVRKRVIEEGVAKGTPVKPMSARYVSGIGWEVHAITLGDAPDATEGEA